MDYEQYLAPVLGVLGIFLQFVRAHRSFNDGMVATMAALLAVAGYALCHTFGADARLEIIKGLLALVGNTSAVLGGTFLGAKAGNAGIVLPRTNSIGG